MWKRYEMTYRVQFFDTDGKLICWYSTPNKSEAERYAEKSPSNLTVEVERVYA